MSNIATPRRRWWRRLLRFSLWAVAGLLLSAGLYLLCAYGLAAVRIDGESQAPDERVEIAIFVGPMHTDVVMPAVHAVHDWRAWLPESAFEGDTAHFSHVAVGWGDRGFYLEAPTWSDLKFSTALIAVSGFGRAATHVEFREDPAQYVAGEAFQMVRATVDLAHYRRLIEFVLAAFQCDAAGRPQPIPARGYWYDGRDAFFEANGSYSMLRTCNVWTCEALRAAGLPRPLWSPFPGGVVKHLPAVR